MKSPRGEHAAPNESGNENDNLISNQRHESIAPETAEANARTHAAAQYPPRASSLSPRASENSSAGSSEGTTDDSFASVLTVVPLQRVGRSLWRPPGSPGAAIDPPRASTDSFRARAFGSRLRAESSIASGSSRGGDHNDPFVDSRSRAGTTGTAGSSTPLINPPPRAHTVQRGREQRRDLTGGRQGIDTTPGERLEISRSIIITAGNNNNGSSGSSSSSSNINAFSRPITNISNPTTTTSVNTSFNNINLSSPLRARTDSTLAMKDGHSGPDDLSRLTPCAKDKTVFGSIKRGINNLGSIRGRKTPGKHSPRDGAPGGGSRIDTSTPQGSSTIRRKKSLANMFGSLKVTMTPKAKAQAAFELQPFPSEQSMIEGLLLHGPQRLELARGGDGRYAAKDKNGPVYPPRLPLEPRTEPRRGDPNSGRFLSPGPASGGAGGGEGAVNGEASRSSRPDPYENKPLPSLPQKDYENDEEDVDYEEWKLRAEGKEKSRGE